MDALNEEAQASKPPATPGAPPIYTSPVLAKLHPDSQPKPWPACATCPASLWFSTSEPSLQCFCTRMHLIVFNGVDKPVMTCDGRELALVELMAQADANP